MYKGPMNTKNSHLILGLLALLAIVAIGGAFVIKGWERKVVSTAPSATGAKNTTSSESEVVRIEDWRAHLDMTLWRDYNGVGTATFKVPLLFSKPNDPVYDVPEMQYAFRVEQFDSFLDDDTPWHTKSDIEEEIQYIAGTNQTPRIHDRADTLIRYSKNNVAGYFSYDCDFGDGSALVSTFTFFDDEKTRYRFEMFEDKDEWQQIQESDFKRACSSYLEDLLRGDVSQEIKDKYKIRQQMIDSIKIN